MNSNVSFSLKPVWVLLAVTAGVLLTTTWAGVTQAAVITYLGNDHANAQTWRSTSVTKNSTYDIDGDNAYGTDGYAMVGPFGTNGESLAAPSAWALDLPSYLSFSAAAGNKWYHAVYPDIDDPRLLIAPTVADITNPASSYNNPSISFTLTSDASLVLTVLSTHNTAGPGTITVTGPGGATASVNDTSTIRGIWFFEMSDFVAGDTFTVSATGPSNSGKFSLVAFETPEPGTIGVLGLGGLALLNRRRPRK